jgi:hypothetical protein
LFAQRRQATRVEVRPRLATAAETMVGSVLSHQVRQPAGIAATAAGQEPWQIVFGREAAAPDRPFLLVDAA